MYDRLVKLLIEHLHIDPTQNTIHITMKPKSAIKGMSCDINDDNNVVYIISLAKNMTQLIHIIVIVSLKSRRESPYIVYESHKYDSQDNLHTKGVNMSKVSSNPM